MNDTHTKVVGAFVVGAVFLVFVVFLVFGSDKFFTATYDYVTFFKGSVDGLDVGAPVKLRGVKIGSVKEIDPVLDSAGAIAIKVIISVEEGIFKIPDGEATDATIETQVKMLIVRGLRAQLATQSFVTGKLIVNLDYFRGTDQKYYGYDKELPEIPSISSTAEQFEKTLLSVMQSLENLNLDKITSHITSLMANLDSLIASPMWKENLIAVNKNLDQSSALLLKIEKSIDPIAANTNNTLKEVQVTLTEMQNFIKRLNNAASDNRYELTEMLNEFTESARSLKRLLNYLEENPSDIIFGK